MRIDVRHPAFVTQQLSVETASLLGGPFVTQARPEVEFAARSVGLGMATIGHCRSR